MLFSLPMASTPERETFKTFRTEAAFESWMRKNHADAREVWLRIYKKDSGVPSITIAEALDVVLCWGRAAILGISSPSLRCSTRIPQASLPQCVAALRTLDRSSNPTEVDQRRARREGKDEGPPLRRARRSSAEN